MYGLQFRGNLTNFYESLLDIRHGPWRIEGCAITCAGGQVRLISCTCTMHHLG
jgi:hypothetical protein